VSVGEEPRTALVVGGDSAFGNVLSPHLRTRGWRVIETTRRGDRDPAGPRLLDLASDDLPQALGAILEEPVDVAFLCAGVTKIAECRRDPEGTARINVEAIEVVSRGLLSHGAFVIFPSVNQVFDGRRPFAKPDDPIAPPTEYGRQKAEAERRLQAAGDAVGIMRFSKVLADSYSVLDSWIDAWRRGKPAQPFADMVMSPVGRADACAAQIKLAELRVPGTYHVSGARDISYADAARIGAETLGVDPRLVRPLESGSSGVKLEHLPQNTTLDCSTTTERLGFVPPDPEPVLAQYFRTSLGVR
jgi:dTDP-4-dehydrorhamnose reductase